MSPIILKQLTLNSRKLSSIPTKNSEEYKQLCSDLVKEGEQVLNLDKHDDGTIGAGWKDHQIWKNGVVETYSLYNDKFIVENHDDKVANDQEEKVEVKKGFWGSSNHKNEQERIRDSEKGFAFHMRNSNKIADPSKGGYNYETYWETLGIKHIEQEIEYLTTLSKAVKISTIESEKTECFLKLFNLPFPTTNRSFFTSIFIHPLPSKPHPIDSNLSELRSFYIFSLPVSPEDELTEEFDKGFVRGKYVSVELIQEVIIDGELNINWRLASMSSAGGNIPIRLSESHMQSSMASHVVPYLAWLKRKYPKPEDQPTSLKVED